MCVHACVCGRVCVCMFVCVQSLAAGLGLGSGVWSWGAEVPSALWVGTARLLARCGCVACRLHLPSECKTRPPARPSLSQKTHTALLTQRTHAHTHTHTHVHTHTHTHTHTQVRYLLAQDGYPYNASRLLPAAAASGSITLMLWMLARVRVT